MRSWAVKILFIVICASLHVSAIAQSKRTNRPAAKPAVPVATPQPSPEPTPDVPPKGKTNKRPGGDDQKTASPSKPPTYFYEFKRPGFTYGEVKIEHDDDGKGHISFLKDGFDAPLTDPIRLTPATLAKINGALTALNFFDSTEDYQYPKDFSNLGNVTLTISHAGKTRTVKYNWTENKNAKILMDEYRRISNEYTWRFEITTARENQPLETPRIMEALAGYVDRGEISDPPHIVPFLNELSTDERLPLIARNRAEKIVKKIEKDAAK